MGTKMSGDDKTQNKIVIQTFEKLLPEEWQKVYKQEFEWRVHLAGGIHPIKPVLLVEKLKVIDSIRQIFTTVKEIIPYEFCFQYINKNLQAGGQVQRDLLQAFKALNQLYKNTQNNQLTLESIAEILGVSNEAAVDGVLEQGLQYSNLQLAFDYNWYNQKLDSGLTRQQFLISVAKHKLNGTQPTDAEIELFDQIIQDLDAPIGIDGYRYSGADNSSRVSIASQVSGLEQDSSRYKLHKKALSYDKLQIIYLKGKTDDVNMRLEFTCATYGDDLSNKILHKIFTNPPRQIAHVNPVDDNHQLREISLEIPKRTVVDEGNDSGVEHPIVNGKVNDIFDEQVEKAKLHHDASKPTLLDLPSIDALSEEAYNLSPDEVRDLLGRDFNLDERNNITLIESIPPKEYDKLPDALKVAAKAFQYKGIIFYATEGGVQAMQKSIDYLNKSNNSFEKQDLEILKELSGCEYVKVMVIDCAKASLANAEYMQVSHGTLYITIHTLDETHVVASLIEAMEHAKVLYSCESFFPYHDHQSRVSFREKLQADSYCLEQLALNNKLTEQQIHVRKKLNDLIKLYNFSRYEIELPIKWGLLICLDRSYEEVIEGLFPNTYPYVKNIMNQGYDNIMAGKFLPEAPPNFIVNNLNSKVIKFYQKLKAKLTPAEKTVILAECLQERVSGAQFQFESHKHPNFKGLPFRYYVKLTSPQGVQYLEWTGAEYRKVSKPNVLFSPAVWQAKDKSYSACISKNAYELLPKWLRGKLIAKAFLQNPSVRNFARSSFHQAHIVLHLMAVLVNADAYFNANPDRTTLEALGHCAVRGAVVPGLSIGLLSIFPQLGIPMTILHGATLAASFIPEKQLLDLESNVIQNPMALQSNAVAMIAIIRGLKALSHRIELGSHYLAEKALNTPIVCALFPIAHLFVDHKNPHYRVKDLLHDIGVEFESQKLTDPNAILAQYQLEQTGLKKPELPLPQNVFGNDKVQKQLLANMDDFNESLARYDAAFEEEINEIRDDPERQIQVAKVYLADPSNNDPEQRAAIFNDVILANPRPRKKWTNFSRKFRYIPSREDLADIRRIQQRFQTPSGGVPGLPVGRIHIPSFDIPVNISISIDVEGIISEWVGGVNHKRILKDSVDFYGDIYKYTVQYEGVSKFIVKINGPNGELISETLDLKKSLGILPLAPGNYDNKIRIKKAIEEMIKRAVDEACNADQNRKLRYFYESQLIPEFYQIKKDSLANVHLLQTKVTELLQTTSFEHLESAYNLLVTFTHADACDATLSVEITPNNKTFMRLCLPEKARGNHTIIGEGAPSDKGDVNRINLNWMSIVNGRNLSEIDISAIDRLVNHINTVLEVWMQYDNKKYCTKETANNIQALKDFKTDIIQYKSKAKYIQEAIQDHSGVSLFAELSSVENSLGVDSPEYKIIFSRINDLIANAINENNTFSLVLFYHLLNESCVSDPLLVGLKGKVSNLMVQKESEAQANFTKIAESTLSEFGELAHENAAIAKIMKEHFIANLIQRIANNSGIDYDSLLTDNVISSGHELIEHIFEANYLSESEKQILTQFVQAKQADGDLGAAYRVLYRLNSPGLQVACLDQIIDRIITDIAEGLYYNAECGLACVATICDPQEDVQIQLLHQLHQGRFDDSLKQSFDMSLPKNKILLEKIYLIALAQENSKLQQELITLRPDLNAFSKVIELEKNGELSAVLTIFSEQADHFSSEVGLAFALQHKIKILESLFLEACNIDNEGWLNRILDLYTDKDSEHTNIEDYCKALESDIQAQQGGKLDPKMLQSYENKRAAISSFLNGNVQTGMNLLLSNRDTISENLAFANQIGMVYVTDRADQKAKAHYAAMLESLNQNSFDSKTMSKDVMIQLVDVLLSPGFGNEHFEQLSTIAGFSQSEQALFHRISNFKNAWSWNKNQCLAEVIHIAHTNQIPLNSNAFYELVKNAVINGFSLTQDLRSQLFNCGMSPSCINALHMFTEMKADPQGQTLLIMLDTLEGLPGFELGRDLTPEELGEHTKTGLSRLLSLRDERLKPFEQERAEIFKKMDSDPAVIKWREIIAVGRENVEKGISNAIPALEQALQDFQDYIQSTYSDEINNIDEKIRQVNEGYNLGAQSIQDEANPKQFSINEFNKLLLEQLDANNWGDINNVVKIFQQRGWGNYQKLAQAYLDENAFFAAPEYALLAYDQLIAENFGDCKDLKRRRTSCINEIKSKTHKMLTECMTGIQRLVDEECKRQGHNNSLITSSSILVDFFKKISHVTQIEPQLLNLLPEWTATVSFANLFNRGLFKDLQWNTDLLWDKKEAQQLLQRYVKLVKLCYQLPRSEHMATDLKALLTEQLLWSLLKTSVIHFIPKDYQKTHLFVDAALLAKDWIFSYMKYKTISPGLAIASGLNRLLFSVIELDYFAPKMIDTSQYHLTKAAVDIGFSYAPAIITTALFGRDLVSRFGRDLVSSRRTNDNNGESSDINPSALAVSVAIAGAAVGSYVVYDHLVNKRYLRNAYLARLHRFQKDKNIPIDWNEIQNFLMDYFHIDLAKSFLENRMLHLLLQESQRHKKLQKTMLEKIIKHQQSQAIDITNLDDENINEKIEPMLIWPGSAYFNSKGEPLASEQEFRRAKIAYLSDLLKLTGHFHTKFPENQYILFVQLSLLINIRELYHQENVHLKLFDGLIDSDIASVFNLEQQNEVETVYSYKTMEAIFIWMLENGYLVSTIVQMILCPRVPGEHLVEVRSFITELLLEHQISHWHNSHVLTFLQDLQEKIKSKHDWALNTFKESVQNILNDTKSGKHYLKKLHAQVSILQNMIKRINEVIKKSLMEIGLTVDVLQKLIQQQIQVTLYKSKQETMINTINTFDEIEVKDWLWQQETCEEDECSELEIEQKIWRMRIAALKHFITEAPEENLALLEETLSKAQLQLVFFEDKVADEAHEDISCISSGTEEDAVADEKSTLDYSDETDEKITPVAEIISDLHKFLDDIIPRYVKQMLLCEEESERPAYGGDVELSVISNLWKVSICVYESDNEHPVRIGNYDDSIDIYYNGINHYQLLVGSSKVSPGKHTTNNGKTRGDCLFDACIRANKVKKDNISGIVKENIPSSTFDEIKRLRKSVSELISHDSSYHESIIASYLNYIFESGVSAELLEQGELTKEATMLKHKIECLSEQDKKKLHDHFHGGVLNQFFDNYKFFDRNNLQKILQASDIPEAYIAQKCNERNISREQAFKEEGVGHTALTFAVSEGLYELTIELLEKFASPNEINNFDLSAIDYVLGYEPAPGGSAKKSLYKLFLNRNLIQIDSSQSELNTLSGQHNVFHDYLSDDEDKDDTTSDSSIIFNEKGSIIGQGHMLFDLSDKLPSSSPTPKYYKQNLLN